MNCTPAARPLAEALKAPKTINATKARGRRRLAAVEGVMARGGVPSASLYLASLLLLPDPRSRDQPRASAVFAARWPHFPCTHALGGDDAVDSVSLGRRMVICLYV